MSTLTTPRILLAGTHAGVGKSLVGIGLITELRRRGLSVSTAVVGPSLLDALILRRLSGRYVRCLDERLLSGGQMVSSLAEAAIGADLVLCAGHGGLYDGTGAGTHRGSDAEVAALLGLPVALIVDVRGFGASLAAVVKGYADLARGFEVAGAILNFVSRSTEPEAPNRDFFAAALQSARQRPLLGALPELGAVEALPPPIITEEKTFTALGRQFLLDLAAVVREHVDIEALLAAARRAPELDLGGLEAPRTGRRCRIAVADDSCFSLCFQDNLDLLRIHGAELVPFSPLADTDLPRRIGGVYLPGAVLNDYGEELAANSGIARALRDFAQRGGVVYSEGAGTAWLCREFRASRHTAPLAGVGLVPATASPGPGLFSYQEGVTVEECVLGHAGLIIKGISTGEWQVKSEERLMRTLRVAKPGAAPVHEGYSPGAQLLATTSFFHFGSNPAVARNLVEAAEVVERLQ